MEREKFKLEYIMNTTSDVLLWEAIGTASGLERWFADKVTCKQRIWVFQWGKDEVRQAEEVGQRNCCYIRFKWKDAERPHEFFELRMSSDELTGVRVLVITDFCDADELDDTEQLWNSQIETLRRLTGF